MIEMEVGVSKRVKSSSTIPRSQQMLPKMDKSA